MYINLLMYLVTMTSAVKRQSVCFVTFYFYFSTTEAGLETLSVLQDKLALPVTVPLVSCVNNYSDYG